MSLHPSLKSNKFRGKRNVRKRYERFEKLRRNMKWVEGMSIYGMPKEKIEKIKTKIKKEKEEVKIDTGVLPTLVIEKEKKKKHSRDVGKIK